MSYTHIYNPAALAEYKEAVAWYNERSEIAALNFITELKEKIDAICKDPFRFRIAYRHFRETSLKKYPYYVIYYVDEIDEHIVISSIFHHKRNPENKYWK